MANINGVDAPVLNDQDYVDKIIDSFTAVDNHDHTAGKGVPLPNGALEAGSVDTAELADGAVTNAKVDASAAIAVTKLAALTASRAAVTDASGFLSVSPTTATELGYLSGVVPAAGAVVYTDGDSMLVSAVGSSGQVLTSGGTGAPTWTSPLVNPMTTVADIIYGEASGTAARLPIGSDYSVLAGSSSIAAGIGYFNFNNSYQLANLGLSTAVGANALTVTLTTGSGGTPSTSSPVLVGFRSQTITSGAFSTAAITSTKTVTVSSGSTLGTASGQAQYLYVYLTNNSGTYNLAISGVILDEGRVWDVTAEGGAGAADSVRLLYGPSSVTGASIRLIGRLLSSQTTAGTWAANMTQVSVMPFEMPVPFCRYTYDFGQVFNSGVTSNVNFETKVHDNYNMVRIAAGAFTSSTGAFATNDWGCMAVMDGAYEMAVFITVASETPSSINATSNLYVGINGTLVSTGREIARFVAQQTSTGLNAVLQGTFIFNVSAGDYMSPYFVHGLNASTASLASSATVQPWVSFKRIGPKQ